MLRGCNYKGDAGESEGGQRILGVVLKRCGDCWGRKGENGKILMAGK